MSLTVIQKSLTLKDMIFIIFERETIVALCVTLFFGGWGVPKAVKGVLQNFLVESAVCQKMFSC
jgi:NADH:ubiquinone oxidoreductase subunit H